MLPILPKHLADRACKLSLLGTVLSSGYSLYSTYGVKYLPTWTLNGPSYFCCVSFPDDPVDLIHLFLFLLCMKKPRELNMAAIQGWLQSVLGAKDFIHLMFSLLLVTSQLHLKSNIQLFSCKFVVLISVFRNFHIYVYKFRSSFFISQLLRYLCSAGPLIMLPDS